eukprot:6314697-Pyramimonas_sp.AAC.1
MALCPCRRNRPRKIGGRIDQFSSGRGPKAGGRPARGYGRLQPAGSGGKIGNKSYPTKGLLYGTLQPPLLVSLEYFTARENS